MVTILLPKNGHLFHNLLIKPQTREEDTPIEKFVLIVMQDWSVEYGGEIDGAYRRDPLVGRRVHPVVPPEEP